MGGTAWSHDAYQSSAATRAASGVSPMDYNDRVVRTAQAEGRTAEIHASLNPRGIRFRESRDSDVHPESNAIIVGLDVTASMSTVPRTVQAELSKLMAMLLQGAIPDPQIMMAAFTDCHSSKNRAWLQLGQFEAGNEIENDLGNLWLEGGGGGTGHESSEMLLYAAARKTSIDCFERRGRKGYLFIITDERAYDTIDPAKAKKVFGDDEALSETVSLSAIVAEASQKYHIFAIIPRDTNNGRTTAIPEFWNRVLDGRVICMPDASTVCETMATLVGLTEGTITAENLDAKLATHGLPESKKRDVLNSVRAYADSLSAP